MNNFDWDELDAVEVTAAASVAPKIEESIARAECLQNVEVEEKRWCPDSWWWYSLQELRAHWQTRWSEDQILEHWEWNMQNTQGLESDAEVSCSWRLTSLSRFASGVVNLPRYQESTDLWPCRYLLFKPLGFQYRAAWPCLVFLHGHFETGNPEYIAKLFSDKSDHFDQFAIRNFVILAPLAERGSGLLHEDGHQFDVDMLAKLIAEATSRLSTALDFKRISVTGYSMGADAAAKLAAKHGRMFASIAAFCGAYEWFKTAALEDCEQMRSVEVRCFHNDLDSYVSAENTNRLMKFMGDVCGGSRLSVRTITVPYPANSLSVKAHLSALTSATGNLQIRIRECDGGSKASWVLRDAVHLHDAHVCWPIVYMNEPTFGLFHWMLQCRSGDERRCWPSPYSQVNRADALQILADLTELFNSSIAFHDISTELAIKAGTDKFLYLAHVQRLIHVVALKYMKNLGFQGPGGCIQLNAAFSFHLTDESNECANDFFQEKWDAMRRKLYGSMYRECWLPCEERGLEFVYPLPSEAVQGLRGGQNFKSMGTTASSLHDKLWRRIREEYRAARLAEIYRLRELQSPELSFEAALHLQSELRDAYADPAFQHKLGAIIEDNAGAPLKVALLRADLAFEAQKDILVKFGFPGTRQSVEYMRASLGKLMNNKGAADGRELAENGDLCAALLGMDPYNQQERAHFNLFRPEDHKQTKARCEEWKEFFANGGWENYTPADQSNGQRSLIATFNFF